MTFRADTSAARSLADSRGRAADDLQDLQATNRQAGDLVLADANPPVVRGDLAAGMYADATDRDVVVASRARHYTFVHWGAPRINVTAQPFILAALRSQRDRIVAVYVDHARDSLARIN